MKRILLVLASIAAFFVPMLAFAPGAQAATGVITNGMAWSPNASVPAGMADVKPNSDYCTMSVVGTDMHGNKIGISAAHCVSVTEDTVAGLPATYKPDGAPVYRWEPGQGARQQIGTIAYRSWNGTGYPVLAANRNVPTAFGTDYVVLKLNNDAILQSNGPGVRIDGVGAANPPNFSVLCKDGQSTGITCGAIWGQNATRMSNLAVGWSGDSGGPAWIDTNPGKIVGYLRAAGEYVKFSAVLNEINSPGSPFPEGKGFVPTNN